MSAEERIAELKKTLEYHIDRYYNQDSPEISDYEYDMMMQELKGLEKEHPELVTPDSPTQRVGGTAKREAGVLVRHNVPMLSLQDVFSKEEVFNFVEEMQKQARLALWQKLVDMAEHMPIVTLPIILECG